MKVVSGKRMAKHAEEKGLRSSMTLFARVSSSEPVFPSVLDAFYSGEQDPSTIAFLESHQADKGWRHDVICRIVAAKPKCF